MRKDKAIKNKVTTKKPILINIKRPLKSLIYIMKKERLENLNPHVGERKKRKLGVTYLL